VDLGNEFTLGVTGTAGLRTELSLCNTVHPKIIAIVATTLKIIAGISRPKPSEK
jgi:hypothetical protein